MCFDIGVYHMHYELDRLGLVDSDYDYEFVYCELLEISLQWKTEFYRPTSIYGTCWIIDIKLFSDEYYWKLVYHSEFEPKIIGVKSNI